jgi:hypothetical protein
MVALLLFACFPAFSLAQSDDTAADTVRDAILKRLRQLCVTDAALHGVLLRSAEAKDSSLKLSGLADDEEQRDALAEKAGKLIAEVPTWAKRYPKGVDVAALGLLPIRSKYLKALQRDFAQDAGPDEVKSLLRQTRLDDAYYDSTAGDLIVAGICVAGRDDIKAPDGSDPAAQARDKLARMIARLLEQDYDVPQWKQLELKVNARDVQVLANPVAEFQSKLTGGAKLNKVWVQRVRYDQDGVLRLEGLVGTDEREPLEQHFKTQFAAHPAVSAPDGAPRWSLAEMKSIAWPDWSKEMQKHLQARPEPLFRSTRLDRAYLAYSAQGILQLLCEGMCTFKSIRSHEDLRADIEARVKAECAKLLPGLEKHVKKANAREIHFVQPVETLQKGILESLHFDNVLITRAVYDAQGTLRIEGIANDKSQVAAIDQWLRDNQSTLPLFLGSREPKADLWSLRDLQVKSWPERLGKIQALFAGRGPLFQKIRLDRVYLSMTSGGLLQLHLDGISLDDRLKEKSEAIEEILRGQIKDDLAALWPEVGAAVGTRIQLTGIKYVDCTPALLQKQVAGLPALDGVRIDNAAFDAEGKLLLNGVWIGPDQQKQILDNLAEVLAASAPAPHQRGFSTKGLAALGSDRVLKQARQWVAATLDDVRLDRLYFDGQGQLRLAGIVPEPAVAKTVAEKLHKLLDGQPDKKLYHPPGRPVTKKDATAELAFNLTPRTAIAGHLIRMSTGPGATGWQGLWIERGYYAEGGTYILTGLVDSARQVKEIDRLLRELSATSEFQVQLAGKWDLSHLKVVPLAPMLQAVREVMPAYRAFDHLQVERVVHQGGSPLIFQVVVVGKLELKQQQAAEQLLKELLQAHPLWKHRILTKQKPALQIMVARQLLPDHRRAALAVYHSLDLLQKSFPAFGLSDGPGEESQSAVSTSVGCVRLPKNVTDASIQALDSSLLHDPENSTAWYLLALCHLSLGQERLAARDVRRMQVVEEADLQQRKTRLFRLEMLQGPIRMLAHQFIARVAAQDLAGTPKMLLPEYQVVANP